MPFASSFLNSHLPTSPFMTLAYVRLILEQPRQIERLEFLGAERGELRGRGSEHLHGAELQGFDLFLVLEQLRVRIDFDLDLAAGVFLGEFLELERAFALRRVVRHDVAVFDDDRGLRPAGAAVGGGDRGAGKRRCRTGGGKVSWISLLLDAPPAIAGQ